MSTRGKSSKKTGSGKAKPAQRSKKVQPTKAKSVSAKSAKTKSAKTKSIKTQKRKPAVRAHAEQPRAKGREKKVEKPTRSTRRDSLQRILEQKRDTLMKEMQQRLGQSLTEEQQRRLESAMDSGDQALVDLEREMGISLQEMRNRERQMIEEALSSLEEGTYGACAECGAEISEKRLQALPFARFCIECQSKNELLEKIEKSEQRT